MPINDISGVARRARIPLLHNCHPKGLWIRKAGMLGMHNGKKSGFLVWRAERARPCTKNATDGVSGHLVWVCLKCAMPRRAILVRRTERAHPCTKITQHSVFAHLVWVCLKRTNPPKSAILVWQAKRTPLCTKKMAPQVPLGTWYGCV